MVRDMVDWQQQEYLNLSKAENGGHFCAVVHTNINAATANGYCNIVLRDTIANLNMRAGSFTLCRSRMLRLTVSSVRIRAKLSENEQARFV